MKTPAKIALALTSIVVLAFTMMTLAVALLFDPNAYRPILVSTVERATGRSFELVGDLGVKLLPCCSVTLGAARLGNPADFPVATFAGVDSAALSLRVWPLLLRREVQIGAIRLEGLDLHLQRLADGRSNWIFAGDRAVRPPTDTGAGAVSLVQVDAVMVRGGKVRYLDQQSGAEYSARDIRLSTGAIEFSGDVLSIEAPDLKLVLAGASLPVPEIDAVLFARHLDLIVDDPLRAVVDGILIDVEALESHLRLAADGRYGGPDQALAGAFWITQADPRQLLTALGHDPGTPNDARALTRLSGTGNWTIDAGSMALTNLDLRPDDARLTGELSLSDFETAALRFALRLDRIDLDRYATAAVAAPTRDEAAATAVPLGDLADLRASGDLQVGELRLRGILLTDLRASLDSRGGPLSFSLAGQGLNGAFRLEGSGNTGGRNPILAGSMSLDGVAPRELLNAFEMTPQTRDPAALGRLDGTAQWRLTPGTLVLDPVNWRLDASTVTGRLAIDDFDRPRTTFNLLIDRMNVDAYLPPAPDDQPAAHREQAPDSSAIPVDLIRALALDGRISAGRMTLFKLELSDVDAAIKAADGLLRVEPLTANLYGGRYRGSLLVDATGERARVTLDQQLAAVQIGDVLRTRYASDLLTGSLSFALQGQGSGLTTAELLRGLTGTVELDLADGVYRGTDFLYELQRARAAFRSESAPAEPANRETPIRALQLRGTIVDGVLKSDLLKVETPYLRLGGGGGLDLVALALDYKLDAELLRSGAEGRDNLADLLGNTIPLTLKGPVASPRVSIDLKDLLTTRARDTLEQRARDLLRDRLGGREPAEPEQPATGETDGPAPTEAPAAPEPREPSTRDLLRRGLRDLLGPPPE
jgi:AsmA protein